MQGEEYAEDVLPGSMPHSPRHTPFASEGCRRFHVKIRGAVLKLSFRAG